MELKITRCRSHEGLRCPKCAAAIKSTDFRMAGDGRLIFNCLSCHEAVLDVELESAHEEPDFCPYCDS